MSAATQFLTFQAWLDHYDQQIRPLREPADAGDATYAPYDEAYNEHLELLHQMIRDKARLLDNADELAAAAAAYMSSLPDFSDFEIDDEEHATWDAAWMRLQRVLDLVGPPQAKRDNYETWLRAFAQEYLRRTGMTWEDGGGDDAMSTQYYCDGFTSTEAVSSEIRRYGLADTGV